MTFTDEDMARIKILAESPYLATYEEHKSLIERLIARMEAAEACLRLYQEADTRGIGWMVVMDKKIEAWRKAKGE